MQCVPQRGSDTKTVFKNTKFYYALSGTDIYKLILNIKKYNGPFLNFNELGIFTESLRGIFGARMEDKVILKSLGAVFNNAKDWEGYRAERSSTNPKKKLKPDEKLNETSREE